jgi:hypothetical protein
MGRAVRRNDCGDANRVILCLCQEDNHRKIIPPYAAAFRDLGVGFLTVDWLPPFDAPLSEVLVRCPKKPNWIFHFESDCPFLPEGLLEAEVPTVTFQVDTYTMPEHRKLWSALFDHAAVFHPGYDVLFQESGHPGAFLHPHAVSRENFDRPDVEREFEVGWVGQPSGPIYRTREEWLPRFAERFRMNDWRRAYSLREVGEVYRRSKVVVNFGRDDFPQDANMRVFEALASGALLVTSLPNELSDLGFVEGEHFVGYREARDLFGLVQKYLSDEPSRQRIANAGRGKVLSEHTYHARAGQMLERLDHFGNQKLAPGLQWPEPRVRLSYLDFYAAHDLGGLAASQFRHIAGKGFRETMIGATLLGGVQVRRLRRVIQSISMRTVPQTTRIS